MALESAGQIDQAITAVQRAITLARDSGQNQVAIQLQQQLSRLRSKKMQPKQPLPKK
jgi:hypothetical protein